MGTAPQTPAPRDSILPPPSPSPTSPTCSATGDVFISIACNEAYTDVINALTSS